MPVLALTATATPRVQHDVIFQLGFARCLVFCSSFNRPKLWLEVKDKSTKDDEVIKDIAHQISTRFCSRIGRFRTPQCGIIYCTSKKSCEEVAHKLDALLRDSLGPPADRNKSRVKHFHAQLDPATKEATQSEWTSGELPIVVATIAFGMGINKADVRFVFHFNVAKSMEGYLQESGRAGRDNNIAHCILYFNWKDVFGIKAMLRKSLEEQDQLGRGGSRAERQQQLEVNLRSIQNMAIFCEDKYRCRREMLLEHFGEKFDREQCNGTCDNCRGVASGMVQEIEVTEAARARTYQYICMSLPLIEQLITLPFYFLVSFHLSSFLCVEGGVLTGPSFLSFSFSLCSCGLCY